MEPIGFQPSTGQDLSPPSSAIQGKQLFRVSKKKDPKTNWNNSELELERTQQELQQWEDRDAQEKKEQAKAAAKAKAAEKTKWPPEVMDALEAWERSWEDKPDLVSLEDDSGAILETPEEVHKRLKLLGTKVLSNREWKPIGKRKRKTHRAWPKL